MVSGSSVESLSRCLEQHGTIWPHGVLDQRKTIRRQCSHNDNSSLVLTKPWPVSHQTWICSLKQIQWWRLQRCLTLVLTEIHNYTVTLTEKRKIKQCSCEYVIRLASLIEILSLILCLMSICLRFISWNHYSSLHLYRWSSFEVISQTV